MSRLSLTRSFNDAVDSWQVAEAAPAPGLVESVTRYSWWRENTGSFDTRRELASTGGVFIFNLSSPLEITDARGRTIRLAEGQAFIGGMAQGTSFSRSTGTMEGIHVFMPIHELARAMAASVADLADRTVTLDEALGHEAGELGERILSCGSTDARLDMLDAFLTQRLTAAPEPDATMAHIMHRLRSGSVSATAERLGWSRKRLASWFSDRAGILPGQFARLARFERFSSAMQRDPDVSLAALACDAGYADQAHLSHDIRRLTGMTPGALRALLLPAEGGVRD